MSAPGNAPTHAPAYGGAHPVFAAIAVLRHFVAPHGPHKVRIFNVSAEHFTLALVSVIFVGFPMFIFAGMLPVWDFLAGLPLLKHQLQLLAAPVMAQPDVQLPELPVKRLAIAAVFTIELLFLGQLFSLGRRKVRRHVLLVWLHHKRENILLYLFLSGIAFCGLWHFFFYDLTALHFVEAHGYRGGQKLVGGMFLAFPVTAVFFGRMTVIVAAGVARAALKYFSRRRSRPPSPMPSRRKDCVEA